MDLLRSANDWLQDTRTLYAASPVQYQRAASSASLKATKGRTEMEFLESGGMSALFQSDDFIVRKVDLELDGEPVQPQPGDRVTVDGADGVYEVVQNPATRKCWRWADAFETAYRIHTRKKGTQSPQP